MDDDVLDPRIWRVAAVVLLGPFMTQLDSTVVNVSLAAIRLDLHASIDSAQWIISGYLLALALMLPLNGWLVDRIGAKRLYLGCFSAFTLASLLCGSARTMEQLIAYRVIQGIAGGLLAPMTQMMMARAAGKHMARVMGFATVPVLLAPILGPVVAGAILKYAPWPWLFFFNLPIGIVAVSLAAYLLPSDEQSIQRRPFDLLGFLTLSPGLACLLYGLEHARHRDGALILAVGLVLVGAFLQRALGKGSAALIDVRLFSNRIFSTAAVTQFLTNGLAYAAQLLIPLYLISACKLSSTQAGWLLSPMGLGMLCSYPLMGYMTERFGCRAVATGGALLALLGVLPFVWMVRGQFSQPLTAIALFVLGAGRGGIGIPSLSAAYASVPRAKLPVATTAANIVQRLGGPLATTLTASVMALAVARLHVAPSDPRAFLLPFLFLILLHGLAAAAASRLPERVIQGSKPKTA